MIAKTPQRTMSHKVVMKEPRLVGASSWSGPKGKDARSRAKSAGPAQIGADIAKNDRAVQRRRAGRKGLCTTTSRTFSARPIRRSGLGRLGCKAGSDPDPGRAE